MGINPDQDFQNHVKFEKLSQKIDEFCLALMIFEANPPLELWTLKKSALEPGA